MQLHKVVLSGMFIHGMVSSFAMIVWQSLFHVVDLECFGRSLGGFSALVRSIMRML